MAFRRNLCVILAPFFLGHVVANQCASSTKDGTCGEEETSVLLQSRLAVDSVEADSSEQLSFSEGAYLKRHSSRVFPGENVDGLSKAGRKKGVFNIALCVPYFTNSEDTTHDTDPAAVQLYLHGANLSSSISEARQYFAKVSGGTMDMRFTFKPLPQTLEEYFQKKKKKKKIPSRLYAVCGALMKKSGDPRTNYYGVIGTRTFWNSEKGGGVNGEQYTTGNFGHGGGLPSTHELGHLIGLQHADLWLPPAKGKPVVAYTTDDDKGKFTTWNGSNAKTADDAGVFDPAAFGLSWSSKSSKTSPMSSGPRDADFDVDAKILKGWMEVDRDVLDLDTVPDLNNVTDPDGGMVLRLHAHDEHTAVYDEEADLWGVERGYVDHVNYAFMYTRKAQQYNHDTNTFTEVDQEVWMDYRSRAKNASEDGGRLYVAVALPGFACRDVARCTSQKAALDMDPQMGFGYHNGREHNQQSLGWPLGREYEDTRIANYFWPQGTGVTKYSGAPAEPKKDFNSYDPPLPPQANNFRPHTYKFKFLNRGTDSNGEYADVMIWKKMS